MEGIRMTELTLEILDEAIAHLKRLTPRVVGFRVNPADLREIKEGTMFYCGIVNDSIVMFPPYQGLRLESDVDQPRGYVEFIKEDEI